jgi:hypothetical protein
VPGYPPIAALAAPVSAAATPSGSPGSDDGTGGTQVGADFDVVAEVLVLVALTDELDDAELLHALTPPKTSITPSAPAARKGRIRILWPLPWRPDRYFSESKQVV